jgi:hypothetical protein
MKTSHMMPWRICWSMYYQVTNEKKNCLHVNKYVGHMLSLLQGKTTFEVLSILIIWIFIGIGAQHG